MDYKDEQFWLMQGDCLERMKEIPSGSVDMILCDLPYGTTACKWDSVIPFDLLWEQYKRVTKNRSAIVLTATQPFTSALVNSCIDMFKYCWVWEKTAGSGFMNAKNAPVKRHEDIVVFSKGTIANKSEKRMNYYPQGLVSVQRLRNPHTVSDDTIGTRPSRSKPYVQEFENYPTTILKFKNDATKQHPTQKPVALMEYMIKTYTNEGETVLDNTMGSGTTGVACRNLNRKFIGIEMDTNYFGIAKNRILGTENQ